MSSSFINTLSDAGLYLTITTLVLLSIINLSVFIERGIFYTVHCRKNYLLTIRSMSDLLRSKEWLAIDEQCAKSSPLESVFLRASTLLKRNGFATRISALEISLEGEISIQRERLEKGLWILATAGSIGPLVGLFGTILGIMRSFAGIAAGTHSGAGVIEAASAGIWESLYTTAFGILVAVPALIAYNYFSRISNRELDRLDTAANTVISVVTECASEGTV